MAKQELTLLPDNIECLIVLIVPGHAIAPSNSGDDKRVRCCENDGGG